MTKVSWYDPNLGGINGNPNAGGCGVPAKTLPWSVAHKSLPCGTIVTFENGDKEVSAPVADRGPYVAGREYDLRRAVATALGVTGVSDVGVAVTTKRIDLKKFAAAGGNASAFNQLMKDKGLPFSASGGLTENVSGDTGGLAQVPGLKQLKDGTDVAVDGAKAIGAAVTDVTNYLFGAQAAAHYLRIGKVLGGLVIVLLGLAAIGKQSILPLPNVKIG